jgi:hypothetical protein
MELDILEVLNRSETEDLLRMLADEVVSIALILTSYIFSSEEFDGN